MKKKYLGYQPEDKKNEYAKYPKRKGDPNQLFYEWHSRPDLK